MSTYQRRPTTALAWKYDPATPQDEWPSWVRDYEVSTTMGLQRIGAGMGVLLIPTKGGVTLNLQPGDYVVQEGAHLAGVRAADFGNMYEAVPDPVAPEVKPKAAKPTPPAAEPAPEPVAEPAAEPPAEIAPPAPDAVD